MNNLFPDVPCPYCLRPFWKQKDVSHHLAFPHSPCHQEHLKARARALKEAQNCHGVSSAPPPNVLDGLKNSNNVYPYSPNIGAGAATTPISNKSLPSQPPRVPLMSDMNATLNSLPNFPSTTPLKPAASPDQITTDHFPNAALTFGRGANTLKRISRHDFVEERAENLYFPFASQTEWEVAHWLLLSGCSTSAINDFLRLNYVQSSPLLFSSARNLQMRNKFLPSGPRWYSKVLSFDRYSSSQPIVLYYWNALECVEYLFGHPLFAQDMDFSPRRVWTNKQQMERMFSEMMSGDWAWNVQSQLPVAATLVPVIMAIDKTHLTMGTGGQVSYPLLLSIANIKKSVRMKAWTLAFLCAAYLPTAKFHVDKVTQSVLDKCLYHLVVDLVTAPLKEVARLGHMMVDPCGYIQHCFTLLAACIVDNPKQLLIAGVALKNSPITTATAKQFGDKTSSPLQTSQRMLAQILELNTQVHPWNISEYVKEAKKLQLNDVDLPFWQDWRFACPSIFFPPDTLHAWHKMVFNLVVQWLKHIMGSNELDFCLSVLHPRVGFRHFSNGITKLKQVTGREQRDLQQVLVGVTSGAVPSGILVAICSHLEVIYLGQSPIHTSHSLAEIDTLLSSFHAHKQSIIAAGGRRGKSGILTHFQIPKIELLNSITCSIRQLGSAEQWTSDTTERCHIELCKNLYRATNHRNHESQMCRAMDQIEKLQLFTLSLAFSHQEVDLSDVIAQSQAITAEINPHKAWISQIPPGEHLIGLTPPSRNFFADKQSVINFSSTAFHLNLRPSFTSSIADIAHRYLLPDLHAAIADYISRWTSRRRDRQRQANNSTTLPFAQLRCWSNMKVQKQAMHNHSLVMPAQSVQACPPFNQWQQGRCNAVLLRNSFNKNLAGVEFDFSVAQICCIFQPVTERGSNEPHLVYAQHFDMVRVTGSNHPYRHPDNNMIVVKQAFWS